MTVHGDLAAVLVSKGKTWDEAKDILNAILDCANSPDFALRYAVDQEAETTEGQNAQMSNYWAVIDFLKRTVG